MPYTSRRPFPWRGSAEAGATTIATNAPERSHYGNVYTLVKESVLTEVLWPAGSLTIDFELKSSIGDNAYGKIYYNEVAIGTERTSGSAYYNFSESFTFSNLAIGDRFQVYVRGYNPDETGYAKNLIIKGAISIFHASTGL